MNKKCIFLYISVLLSTHSVELSKNEREIISKNEKEILKVIKNNKINNDKLFYLYLIAARDFHIVNIEEYYLKYLNKAKNLKTKEDKSEVYWRLITFYNHDKSKVNNLFKEWKKNNYTPEKSLSQAFKVIELKLSSDSYKALTKEQIKELEKGPFSYQFSSERVDQLIKQEEYEKALSFINPKKVDDQMISSIIRFDLLNQLVHGKREQSPICLDTYNKYKDSPSYSIKICKALLEHNEKGRIKKSTLKEVHQIIHMKEFQNESFLYKALASLNKS
jgi:hypothetical protein